MPLHREQHQFILNPCSIGSTPVPWSMDPFLKAVFTSVYVDYILMYKIIASTSGQRITVPTLQLVRYKLSC